MFVISEQLYMTKGIGKDGGVKMTSKHLKEKSLFLSVKMAGCDKESD